MYRITTFQAKLPVGAVMLRVSRKSKCDVLITGGAGFVGANLASHLLSHTDARITLFDSLDVPGAQQNLSWLHSQASRGRLRLVRGDIRSATRVSDAAARADEIYHLGQYCARDERPLGGQETEAVGTFNVLEAARRSERNPVVVCTSIGSECLMKPAVGVEVGSDRLIQDFAQTHHLRTVLLRVDTVTGSRQFGEAQDWVARAAYAVLAGRACPDSSDSLLGHDVLHVADVVGAILAAHAYIGRTAGHAYRVSGGASHWITCRQMIQLIERIGHRPAKVERRMAAGDAAVAHLVEEKSFRADTSWRARRSLEETVRDIVLFWNATQQLMARQTTSQDRTRGRAAGFSQIQVA